MSLTSRLLGLRTTSSADPGDGGTRAAQVGTQTLTYTSPGAPMQVQWDASSAVAVGYLGHVYSYRCARHIAHTIAGLAFRAGRDPDSPGTFDPAAPLAQLLGPAPGGPAPQISPRQFWIWTVLQYLITGRWAWETELATGGDRILNLWPLPARYVMPIMSSSPGRWWDGYRVQAPTRQVDLRLDQAFYAWRPSQDNWREPESMLQAAAHTVSIGVAMDRFMTAFMRNNMVGSKLIVTPPFDEGEMRRAFQDQFLAEMTSVDNAGRTAFAEWDDDGSGTAGAQKPNVQVVDLASKFTDAQFIEMKREIKTDICVAWGVPVSMIGNASERTYENADQEHRNYWTGTILPLVAEIADHVNIGLAPRLGREVGWFDLSKVEALRPARAFQADTPTALVEAGIVDKDEVRQDLGLAPRDPKAPPIIEPLPSADDTPGAGGKSNFGGGRDHPLAQATRDRVAEIRAVREDVEGWRRAQLTSKVLAYLQQNYPDKVLGWVEDADWRYETAVPLDKIQMARRPGGRDQAKVAGIADAIAAGKRMEPVVLVDTGEGHYEVADGYHRTLAFQRAGRTSIPAYVGSGVGEHGPWEQAMHDAKLNRTGQDLEVRYDTSPLGEGKNWVTKVGGLPVFIRAIAHALIRNGHAESDAIAIAVGTVKNWADGQGHVSPKTRAKAAAAVAEWEAKKAAAHAKREALTEASSAGALLPTTSATMPIPRQAHLPVRGTVRGKCARCGQPIRAAVHRSAMTSTRHAGHGHHPVQSGHANTHDRRRTALVRATTAHAATFEPQVAGVMRQLFADQAKATVDRVMGKRGRQMVRAAQPPVPEDPAVPPASLTSVPVDAAAVFEAAFWTDRTATALGPVYAGIAAATPDRVRLGLGKAVLVTPGSPDEAAAPASSSVADILTARARRLAERVTQTTADDITAALNEGLAQGEGIGALAARVRRVFEQASQVRAETISRTEVIAAMNEAAHTYATGLGPQVTREKEWLAVDDHRTRPSHAAADRQRRVLSMPFDVGTATLQFPGDPAAPPSETINCRCTLIYVPAAAAKPAVSVAA